MLVQLMQHGKFALPDNSRMHHKGCLQGLSQLHHQSRLLTEMADMQACCGTDMLCAGASSSAGDTAAD